MDQNIDDAFDQITHHLQQAETELREAYETFIRQLKARIHSLRSTRYKKKENIRKLLERNEG